MQINRWPFIGMLLASAVVGAGAIIASTVVNHRTSTDAFCSTSCHSMVFQASNDHFQHSKHRSNTKGVIASCADCHIPTTNWFIETYTHVTSGARDVFMDDGDEKNLLIFRRDTAGAIDSLIERRKFNDLVLKREPTPSK